MCECEEGEIPEVLRRSDASETEYGWVEDLLAATPAASAQDTATLQDMSLTSEMDGYGDVDRTLSGTIFSVHV